MPPIYQPWTEFFSDLETGDIILMHGMFGSSIFIEKAFGINWSHAAIIVKSGDLGVENVPSSTILLWESNIKNAVNPGNLKVTDVILGVEKDGPILDRLAERITNNHTIGDDTDVAKRKLNVTRSPAMFGAIKAVIASVHQDGFPPFPVGEMLHFAMGRLHVPVTDHTFFCSQLAAHTLKAMQLLDTSHLDNWYAPANFADCPHAVALQGATLGPEVRLDLSTIPPYPGA